MDQFRLRGTDKIFQVEAKDGKVYLATNGEETIVLNMGFRQFHQEYERVVREEYTSEYENKHITDCPFDLDIAAKIEDYRNRQKQGNAQPQWGKWSEFPVSLMNKTKVMVLYEPAYCGDNSDHFEFHGCVSETGYISFFTNSDQTTPALDEFALRIAQKAADEYEKKARKEKTTQPDFFHLIS